MAFRGLTINTNESESPHFYAENDAAIYQAILGDGNLLMQFGENFRIEVLSYNTIRVHSGLLSVQGHMGVIEIDDSQDLVLENGTSGVVRNDLLVARFSTTGNHGIDTFSLVILKGGSNGELPAYNNQDLNDGGKVRDFPIAKITMNGLSISTATALQTPATCMKDMLHALNERITYGTGQPSGGKDGDIYIMYEA